MGFSAIAEAPPLMRYKTRVLRRGRLQQLENGVAGAQRIGIGKRMTSDEIAKTQKLGQRCRRAATIPARPVPTMPLRASAMVWPALPMEITSVRRKFLRS